MKTNKSCQPLGIDNRWVLQGNRCLRQSEVWQTDTKAVKTNVVQLTDYLVVSFWYLGFIPFRQICSDDARDTASLCQRIRADYRRG